MEFFRHCPACGRRFHIKLETKKLVGSQIESIPTLQMRSRPFGLRPIGFDATSDTRPPLGLHEGRPIVVDVEEFQYTYRCGHCGHEWSEKRLGEHKSGDPTLEASSADVEREAELDKEQYQREQY